MSTTLSMWLGISFVVLAVLAVLLQAWLWGPKYWDEENQKSLAPRGWTMVHRLVGFSYAGIYTFMMWHMVPRLWQYQFELPARTVIHAVMGITIGVILVTKISILRFFRHFEKAMPSLGIALLVCTVNLAILSLPFAVRAHDFGGRTLEAKNLERVRRVLGELALGHGVNVGRLTTRAAFESGREVLTRKCTVCHDLRTILVQPRTGRGWHDVVQRMADKPIIGDPISDRDVLFVTSYLVAITPELQQSRKRRMEEDRERAEAAADLTEAPGASAETAPDEPEAEATVHREAGAEPTAEHEPAAAEAAATAVAPGTAPHVNAAAARAIMSHKCTECHGLDEIRDYGRDTPRGWTRIVRRMIMDEGAEVTEREARLVTRYLIQEYGR